MSQCSPKGEKRMFLAMSVKDRDRLKVIPGVNLGELSVS